MWVGIAGVGGGRMWKGPRGYHREVSLQNTWSAQKQTALLRKPSVFMVVHTLSLWAQGSLPGPFPSRAFHRAQSLALNVCWAISRVEKGEEKDTGGQGHGRSQQPGTSKCSHVHKMAGELAVARNSTNRPPSLHPLMSTSCVPGTGAWSPSRTLLNCWIHRSTPYPEIANIVEKEHRLEEWRYWDQGSRKVTTPGWRQPWHHLPWSSESILLWATCLVGGTWWAPPLVPPPGAHTWLVFYSPLHKWAFKAKRASYIIASGPGSFGGQPGIRVYPGRIWNTQHLWGKGWAKGRTPSPGTRDGGGREHSPPHRTQCWTLGARAWEPASLDSSPKQLVAG